MYPRNNENLQKHRKLTAKNRKTKRKTTTNGDSFGFPIKGIYD